MLGVMMDGTGGWKTHCLTINTSLNSKLHLLRALKSIVIPNILKMVYWSCFHSTLSYCILVWGHSTWARDVFKTQRKAIRVLGSLPHRADCRAAYRSLGILTLPSVYIYRCLIYVHGKAGSIEEQGAKHSYNTRKANDLQISFVRLEGSKNVDYWGVRLFNLLPMTVKCLPKTAFCRLMKDFLLRGAFYSLEKYMEA